MRCQKKRKKKGRVPRLVVTKHDRMMDAFNKRERKRHTAGFWLQKATAAAATPRAVNVFADMDDF